MINLRVKNDDVLINERNKVLIKNSKQLYNFTEIFYSTETYIGNNIINNKNYLLLDLSTYQKIQYNKNFIKDTLFYKYITLLLNNIKECDKDKIFNRMNMIIKNNINDYEINNNFLKLINSVFIFKNNVSIEKMIKYIIKNETKKVIILFNSDYLSINFLKNNNTYTFDISQNNKITEYNLVYNENLNEFNFLILQQKIVHLLPYKVNNSLKSLINKYFNCYYAKKEYYIYNSEELIISLIINKLLNNNQKIRYSKTLLKDNIIKSLTNY